MIKFAKYSNQELSIALSDDAISIHHLCFIQDMLSAWYTSALGKQRLRE